METEAKPTRFMKTPAETRRLVEASLRARHNREMRFRMYGIAAVLVSVTFVLVFFATIIAQGHSAFFQTYVKLDVFLDPAVIDPDKTA